MEKLKEKRNQLADEYRGIIEVAKGEKRSLSDEEANKLEDLKTQIEQVNSEIESLKKEEELRNYIKNVPTLDVERREGKETFSEIRSALQEKRAVTINGSGAYNVVSEIVKVIQAKKPLLNMVRYFYGPNASTNIPILSASVATPSYTAEGTTDASSDTSATLGAKSLTPYSFVSVLPVSSNALAMSGADFEAELPMIFAEAFGRAMHAGVLQGAGTTGNFSGLFLDSAIPAANDIDCDAAGNPDLADLIELALKVQDYVDDGVIILNPTIYSGIMSDTTTGYDVYKEELARGKTIEGVPVILTSGAPSATTDGSIVAVAGPMSAYGVAVANSLEITPIKVKGDTNTYFQAEMFMNGAPIIGGNFFALKAISED